MPNDLVPFAALAAFFLILWGVFYFVLPTLWRLLSAVATLFARLSLRSSLLAHWSSRVRTGMSPIAAYLPVAAIVILGAAGVAYFGEELLDLTEMVRDGSPALRAIDNGVHDWAIAQRSAPLTTMFVTVTNAAGPIGDAAIAIAASVALLVTRRYRWLLYFAITSGAGTLFVVVLKAHFARARPDIAEMLRQAHGFSFPSGHAMGATVTFGALAYLAIRLLHRWCWKAAVLSFACTVVLAVSISRVYLAVHWISDVGAGIAAGALWVATTTLAYEVLRRIRLIRVRARTARS